MAKLSQLSQIVLLLNERSSCLLVAARLLSTCQSIVRFKAWLVSPSLPFVATIDSFGLETVPLRPPKPTLLAKWKKAKYKKRVTDWAAALVLKFCQKGGKVHHFFFLTYSWGPRSSQGMMMTQTCQPSCAIPQGEFRGEELPPPPPVDLLDINLVIGLKKSHLFKQHCKCHFCFSNISVKFSVSIKT